MGVPSPNIVTDKLTEQVQVFVNHFEHWFPANVFRLTAHQNKSRPEGELIQV